MPGIEYKVVNINQSIDQSINQSINALNDSPEKGYKALPGEAHLRFAGPQEQRCHGEVAQQVHGARELPPVHEARRLPHLAPRQCKRRGERRRKR